jgi:trans-aconitate 2-methyltransferase
MRPEPSRRAFRGAPEREADAQRNARSVAPVARGAAFRSCLRLLAATYAESSAALLASAAAPPGGAVDLGCGPGHSTELVARVIRPTWIVGFDRSENLVSTARRRLPAIRFEVHDVTAAPFPVPPAALGYSRFLLTHLPDPSAALRAFRQALMPGGVLVLEETATLACDHPVLQRYYDLVEALQAHYGQRMHLGADLADLVRAEGFTVEHADVAPLALAATRMARLHALNLRTWGTDPFALERFDAAELEELGRTLLRVADGEEIAPPVRNGMGQVVARWNG